MVDCETSVKLVDDVMTVDCCFGVFLHSSHNPQSDVIVFVANLFYVAQYTTFFTGNCKLLSCSDSDFPSFLIMTSFFSIDSSHASGW